MDVVFPLRPAHSLSGNSLGDIVDAAFLEERLSAVLHLDDDFLSVACLAQDVVDERTVFFKFGGKLLVEECDVLYLPLSLEEVVQEVDE